MRLPSTSFQAALLILTTCGASALFAVEPAARWEGHVLIPGRELQLVIDLQSNNGQWSGSAVIPGFDIKGAPLTEIIVTGSDIAFTIKGVLGNPKLAGHLTPEGTFAGTFTQGGNQAAFLLQKTGPPQVDLPPQSTAVRKELEGAWQGEMTLTTYPVKVALELANNPDGKATAKLVITGKRETKVPVDLITQDGATLTLKSTDFQITYEAHLREGAPEIIGTFIEGPFEVPLTLHPMTRQTKEAGQ